MTTHYFRGSNRKNSNNVSHGYLKQLFQKRARLEYYRLNSKEKKESPLVTKRNNMMENFYLNNDLYKIDDLKNITFVLANYEKVNEADDEFENNLTGNLECEDITEDLHENDEEQTEKGLIEELPENFYEVSSDEMNEDEDLQEPSAKRFKKNNSQ